MRTPFNCRHGVALLSVMGSAFALPSFAQENADPFGPKVMEEVIVIAPRTIRREQIDRTSGGGRVEQITLTRRVSYADLDLKAHADVVELERRVEAMAEESCGMIADAVPFVDPEPSHEQCVERAIAGAMTQVQAAVDAAAD